jgi:hypothetical protein
MTSRRYQKATTQRHGEDTYEFLARTIRTLRFRDLPGHVLIRNNDRKQVEAIQLYANLKMVQWTRALTFGTVILGVCTIVAAFIARG